MRRQLKGIALVGAVALLVGCPGDEQGTNDGGMGDTTVSPDVGAEPDDVSSNVTNSDLGSDADQPDVAGDMTPQGRAGVVVIAGSGLESCLGDPEVLFDTFLNGSINANKSVIFAARLTGTGVDLDNNSVICVANDGGTLSVGAMRAVARAGDPAPGLAGRTFNNMMVMAHLDDSDNAHILAQSLAPQQTGLWAETGGALELVAAEGVQAAGLPAGVMYRASANSRVDGDDSLFAWGLQGGSVTGANDEVLWRGTPGAVTLEFREGDPAPGLTDIQLGGPADYVVSGGELAFYSPLSGTGTTPLNNGSVWRSSGGGPPSLVFRFTDPAPGTAGETFNGFGGLATNASGDLAFVGKHTGTGPGNAIWAEVGGALTLVAQTGDAAPGTGGNFDQLGRPAISAAGELFFLARLQVGGSVTAMNDSGLWALRGGTLSLVAREGDPAPGVAGGTYSDNGSWAVTHSAAGALAFIANLEGTTLGRRPNALFAEVGGVVSPILVPGDMIEHSPGDLRELVSLTMITGATQTVWPATGRAPTLMHDDGEIVVIATLMQNSQAVLRVDTTP